MNSSPFKTYTAALIIIGNEILSGRTQDTNTSWLAEKLVAMGIRLREVRVVPDVESDIIAAVNALRVRMDYVFTTGGIGPTHDDITSESIAKAFNTELELSREAHRLLINHYGGEAEVTPPRRKMAMIPKGAGLIANPVSAAPGFYIENVYVMAGVPRIMQAMFDHVKTMLTPGDPILSTTIACGLQESTVAEDLTALQHKYPAVDIGSYPHFRGGILGLSLVLRSTDALLLDSASQDVIAMIRRHGGQPHALSVRPDGDTLATSV